MAQIVCPLVSAADRARLEAISADRNRAQKHVARARIILSSAARLSVAEVARRAGVGRPAVWRWQRRFAEAGVDGLLRDATRKPGKAPLAAATVRQVVALTCTEPPGAATHWTGRAMARRTGVSLRSVQRIWAAHDLQPHRIRTFKRSNDPEFATKLADIVGLYVDPPKHAPVLSIDEKSQIQALDRTQPGLPLKPGKAGTMTHDDKRHGTTTLFAALNVLEGSVISRCMQRHRHQEFLRFLNAVKRGVPAGKLIHAILDNYAAHKHPKSSGGSPAIPAGPSTSRRPRAPGSTPSRPSSRRSPDAGSSAAASTRSSTCKLRSTATSPSTTPIPSPSPGPNPPARSSPN
jgi:transposase